MRVSWPTKRMAGVLSAGLLLAVSPALAEEPPVHPRAAKANKLAFAPGKGDLWNRASEDSTVDATESGRPATKPRPAFIVRGSPARKLVDVAVREDGLWLNSFATRSMPLDALSCAVLSDEIVEGLALSAGAVHRLAQEELMRQTRVCAINGSLLLTCYGGDATVSLRPAQHGDGCGG